MRIRVHDGIEIAVALYMPGETGPVGLRASHRPLDPQKSLEMEPYHTHSDQQPIEPGRIYRFDFSVEPMARRFKMGNRPPNILRR